MLDIIFEFRVGFFQGIDPFPSIFEEPLGEAGGGGKQKEGGVFRTKGGCANVHTHSSVFFFSFRGLGFGQNIFRVEKEGTKRTNQMIC